MKATLACSSAEEDLTAMLQLISCIEFVTSNSTKICVGYDCETAMM